MTKEMRFDELLKKFDKKDGQDFETEANLLLGDDDDNFLEPGNERSRLLSHHRKLHREYNLPEDLIIAEIDS